MRIAVVHPYPVHARAVGGTTRVHALVRHLATRHDVQVLAHATEDPDQDREAVEDLAAAGVVQRLFRQPPPTMRRRVRWLLGPDPYFVGRNRNPRLEAALASAAEASPAVDVVHTEFAYLRPLLPAGPRRPALVLAEQETMSLAIRRLGRLPRGHTSLYEKYLQTQLRRVEAFERAVLPGYDRAFAITATESRAMEALGGREVGVLPHVVCSHAFAPDDGPEERDTVLFVGNYRHRPNLHALHWFLDSVWPRVRREAPHARFRVVGPGLTTAERGEATARPGVEAPGRVENLVREYCGATVFVNPVKSGGGMRGKVLEALSCGRPLVSTRLGMEGVDAEDGLHARLADTPDEFADAVVAYFRSADLRRAHGAAGRELARTTYDRRVVFDRLEDVYGEVVERRASAAAVRA